MASAPPSSGQHISTPGSPNVSNFTSFVRNPGLHMQPSGREQRNMEDENDSSDEWGFEIPVGDLIIDLDADLQKDEQKKSDARNTNSNNNIKGSGGNPTQPTSLTDETQHDKAENNGNSTKSSKSSANVSVSSSAPSKQKSKGKKSSKSVSGNKHSNSSSTTGKTDCHSSVDGKSLVKSEALPASKSGRNSKKHSKNMSNGEKKVDNGATGTKDGREKQMKTMKGNNKHMTHSNSTIAQSPTNPSYVSSQDCATTAAQAANSLKGVRGSSDVAMIPPHTDNRVTSSNDTSVSNASSMDEGNHVSDVPKDVLPINTHLGKHKKTNSLPSPMKFTSSSNNPIASSPKFGRGGDTVPSSTTVGKRDRNNTSGCVQNSSNKKIKLEKDTKGYIGGVVQSDGDSLIKGNTASTVSLPANVPGQLSSRSDYKMTVGHQKLPSEGKSERRSSSRNTSSSTSAKNSAKNSANTSVNTSASADQESIVMPQNNIPTPGDQKRSVGTLTTNTDIGVNTEPESLGPCEPGTNVNLSGIVWHETESGVLVVNVTWRNRSYVGTLLDATKHDWAPPRIPDVDSDAEFRAKTGGRPKRQRNGNGLSEGRKSRKSAANNNNDEYKCSPSTSNKRRCNKISESDACSGNDGDLCATPSKSAKRARMSQRGAGKQSSHKPVNTTTAVKESSGDGTSGSGSSTCSSPVFLECSFANCKKRYSEEAALKYHEAFAHKDEDADKTNSGKVDSSQSATSESPENDSSNKSTDDTMTSDSNGSPNEPEKNGCDPSALPKPMETTSSSSPQVLHKTQTPFVVTQPTVPMTTTSESIENFSATSLTNSNSSNPTSLPQTAFANKPVGNEAPRTSMVSATNFERTVKPSCENVVDRALSPYTLTDSQTSESISLKSSTRSYHSSRNATSYGESPRHVASGSHLLPMDNSSAVDNESAQAVQTLLKLQENSHDQLPGLTPYSQPSRSAPLQTSKELPSASVAASMSLSQGSGEKLSPSGHSLEPASKNQHSGIVTQQFRGHSKDGTPLPRMSVGVSSPRNQYSSGQFVNVNYPHGAVNANSPQDRTAHNMPNSGLKTVKGKTVPIPTDPQQTLAPSPSHGTCASNTPTTNAVNAAKKQKRKKQRPEYISKSPTEQSSRSNNSNAVPLEQGRVKQDSPQLTSIPGHTRGHLDDAEMPNHIPPHQRDVTVKSEPSSGSRPHNLQNTKPQTQRPMMHPQSELAQSEQGQFVPIGGKGYSSKVPQNRVQTEQGGQMQYPPHVKQHLGFRDDRIEGKGRSIPPTQKLSTASSLPGSRSLTPVSSSQPVPKQAHLVKEQTHGRPPSTDSASPILPSRRLSAEGKNETKRPIPHYLAYGRFPMMACGDQNFMQHPKLTRFFEHVITQEYEKERPKEEKSKQNKETSSLRQDRMTPSPTEASKPLKSKSPVREGRGGNESPSRGPPHLSSPHPSQALSQRIMHNVQRGATPRESPVPQELGKLGGTAGVRGPSPQAQATPPPTSGKRPPRPNSDTDRFHRRDPSVGERQNAASRSQTANAMRKSLGKESYQDQPSQSPDKKPGPHPSSLYAPGVPMQIPGPGGRPQLQYFPGGYAPAPFAPYLPAAYLFSGHHPMFPPGHWPTGGPPTGIGGQATVEKSQTPHPTKSQRDRPSSGSRSPFRDDGLPRDAQRSREPDPYSGAKERRTTEGPSQSRRSITPDPKTQVIKNVQGETENPPMQRHLHTHHHIHEGFPILPGHPPYPYQMAASAVLAGTEAAALAPFPKRELQ